MYLDSIQLVLMEEQLEEIRGCLSRMRDNLRKMDATCNSMINTCPSMSKSIMVSDDDIHEIDTSLDVEAEEINSFVPTPNIENSIPNSQEIEHVLLGDEQVLVSFMDLSNPVAAKSVSMVVNVKDHPAKCKELNIVDLECSSGLHMNLEEVLNSRRMNPGVNLQGRLVELQGWPPPVCYVYCRYEVCGKNSFTVRYYIDDFSGRIFLHIGVRQASLDVDSVDSTWGQNQQAIIWTCSINDWVSVVCFFMYGIYTKFYWLGNLYNDVQAHRASGAVWSALNYPQLIWYSETWIKIQQSCRSNVEVWVVSQHLGLHQYHWHMAMYSAIVMGFSNVLLFGTDRPPREDLHVEMLGMFILFFDPGITWQALDPWVSGMTLKIWACVFSWSKYCWHEDPTFTAAARSISPMAFSFVQDC